MSKWMPNKCEGGIYSIHVLPIARNQEWKKKILRANEIEQVESIEWCQKWMGMVLLNKFAALQSLNIVWMLVFMISS